MASVIIGSAINTKVLQRQNFSKEPNGLETVIEAYAIKTSNRDTVVPNKGVLHSAFSSSTKTYTRMVVESVSTEEQDGGITQMLVTYVGLTTLTGLPPAIVRLIPTAGAGIFGPDMIVEVELVTDKSETEFARSGAGGLSGKSTRISGLARRFIPEEVHGTRMPSNPIEPFNKSGVYFSQNYYGYTQQSLSCDKRGLFLIGRVTYAEEIFTITSG